MVIYLQFSVGGGEKGYQNGGPAGTTLAVVSGETKGASEECIVIFGKEKGSDGRTSRL